MEELQDASIHHMTAKVIAAIKNTKSYEPIYKELQKLVCNPSVDTHDMRNTLEDAIKSAGLETEIRNIVYNLVRTRLSKTDDKNLANKQGAVGTTFKIQFIKFHVIEFRIIGVVFKSIPCCSYHFLLFDFIGKIFFYTLTFIIQIIMIHNTGRSRSTTTIELALGVLVVCSAREN